MTEGTSMGIAGVVSHTVIFLALLGYALIEHDSAGFAAAVAYAGGAGIQTRFAK